MCNYIYIYNSSLYIYIYIYCTHHWLLLVVSHVDPHLRSPTLWLRRCGFCRVSLAICIRPSNKCNPLNDSEKLNLNELDHCLSGSNLTKFYLFEGAIDVRGRSYIYIYLLLVCILSPRKKWKCNRGLRSTL